jgi:hypothetical protein
MSVPAGKEAADSADMNDPEKRRHEHDDDDGEARTNVNNDLQLEDDDDDDDDKGQTFRKRRLSLTNLRQYDQDTGDDGDVMQSPKKKTGSDDRSAGSSHGDDDSEVKGHTFRKRRLSLTHKRHEEEDSSHVSQDNNKRRRRGSECSVDTMGSNGTAAVPPHGKNLKSRTVHSSELLAHPPFSPASSSSRQDIPMLYQQAAPPQQQPLLETLGDSKTAPKWKKRHTRHVDDKSLPFPRHIVGTFSCHGVEPIYDSDYQPEVDDEQDDDEDDEWVVGSGGFGGKKIPDAADTERPTMAAKINQDRGGVAFPYGNCAKTALFAVYDGMCDDLFLQC